MSTTYAKMRATIAEMSRNASWTPQELKDALVDRDRKRDENNFHTRQRASDKKKPLSPGAFEKLFNLMAELDLIRKDRADDFVITDIVRKAVDDDARYKLLLSARVTEFLDRNGAKIGSIRQAAESINYPDVRDPETILEILKRGGEATKFNVSTFTQILFLLAGAEQTARRHMRIFYEFR